LTNNSVLFEQKKKIVAYKAWKNESL